MKSKELNKWHNNIPTKYVFSKNNQVYLKKENTSNSNAFEDEYFPINFHWIPVIKLKNKMKN